MIGIVEIRKKTSQNFDLRNFTKSKSNNIHTNFVLCYNLSLFVYVIYIRSYVLTYMHNVPLPNNNDKSNEYAQIKFILYGIGVSGAHPPAG